MAPSTKSIKVAGEYQRAHTRKPSRTSIWSERLVGVIRNPASHLNQVNGLEPLAGARTLVRIPSSHAMLRNALTEFASQNIDYLAIEGGDGTMRDVMTCGTDIFADAWPAIILLPRGKTNTLSIDLGLPSDWSLENALEAARQGGFAERRPLSIAKRDMRSISNAQDELHGSREGNISGFFLGAGAFTLATEAAQDIHRRSMFGGLAVAVTVLWSVLQIVFAAGKNRWRQCAAMRLRHWPSGHPLPHCERTLVDSRFLLVATTLERFPAGIRPFRKHTRRGFNLAMIDKPSRWLLALLPLIALGFFSSSFPRHGAHRLRVNAVSIDFGDPFIVDGEVFSPGKFLVSEGKALRFVVPKQAHFDG